MTLTRSLILIALMIAASCGSVCAQRQRVPPPRDSQFYAPRNTLEEFESRLGTVLVKGHTYVGTVRGQGGNARVEAMEIRDTGNSQRALGAVIIIAPDGAGEIRSLIPYEDIEPLIRAIDSAAKADETLTKLTHFEVRYRTTGDFEVIVFKQLAGGAAVAVEGGFFEHARLLLTLEDLTKLRWMIAQAKDRLDEIKN
jgi:hypothetical protein